MICAGMKYLKKKIKKTNFHFKVGIQDFYLLKNVFMLGIKGFFRHPKVVFFMFCLVWRQKKKLKNIWNNLIVKLGIPLIISLVEKMNIKITSYKIFFQKRQKINYSIPMSVQNSCCSHFLKNLWYPRYSVFLFLLKW